VIDAHGATSNYVFKVGRIQFLALLQKNLERYTQFGAVCYPQSPPDPTRKLRKKLGGPEPSDPPPVVACADGGLRVVCTAYRSPRLVAEPSRRVIYKRGQRLVLPCHAVAAPQPTCERASINYLPLRLTTVLVGCVASRPVIG